MVKTNILVVNEIQPLGEPANRVYLVRLGSASIVPETIRRLP